MTLKRSRPTISPHGDSGLGTIGKISLIIGILVILTGIGSVVLYNFVGNDRVVLDPYTGCPINGPVSRTVVLIDQTDTFSSVQAVDIQNQFDAYKASVPRYGELVVYTIGATVNAIPSPVIRVCNPGGEDDVDRLVESPVRIMKLWKESFDLPMREVIETVLKPMESRTSPIIETIQAVVVTEFGPTRMDKTKKSLVVISDLLQHSDALSQYRGSVELDAFLNSVTFKKLSADMRDVSIDFLYLYRATQKNLQNEAHRKFWIGLIHAQHGLVNKFYSVSG